ncbi:MAG: glycosyltransferase [Gemmatimonadota bacterium]
MARIVTVYNTERDIFRQPRDMAHIRWIRMSEALARCGHQVDIASAEFTFRLNRRPVQMAPNLRRIPLGSVRWNEYDVVKTLFHQGFTTLRHRGGADHPFIIAKLGSVVGPADMAGIYFYGAQRRRMFEVQRDIHARARHITVLSPPAQTLWEQSIGAHAGFLLVPGATDAELPPLGPDPFPPRRGIRCVFSGNLYNNQPEATRVLSQKLNELGARIASRGSLYVLGGGDRSKLDPRFVTHLGSVPHESAWDHMRCADVGVVVSAGPWMHNNESTKIYYYLRAGLPVVSESGFPNDHVVHASGLGYVVANGDIEDMTARVIEASRQYWDRDAAQRYILAHHTWDKRAAVYDDVLRAAFPIDRND